MQNTSHAVMAQRTEGKHSLDDFPTPPWAIRALVTHIIDAKPLSAMTCLEPACGRGHMSVALGDYFADVHSSDIFDYGFGSVSDFLKAKPVAPYDWVITNPPFRLAEDFIERSLKIARHGVAMLARTVFIESVGRYERLFKLRPPSIVAQFTERVPMVKGRLDRKASTATGYAWIVWKKPTTKGTRLVWIPACRKTLEREGDYVQSPARTSTIQAGNVVPINKRAKELDLFEGVVDGNGPRCRTRRG
jgi:hypothetical protein